MDIPEKRAKRDAQRGGNNVADIFGQAGNRVNLNLMDRRLLENGQEKFGVGDGVKVCRQIRIRRIPQRIRRVDCSQGIPGNVVKRLGGRDDEVAAGQNSEEVGVGADASYMLLVADVDGLPNVFQANIRGAVGRRIKGAKATLAAAGTGLGNQAGSVLAGPGGGVVLNGELA